MAWTVPSTNSISERLRGSLRRYLPGTDALVWPNNLTAIVKTVAAGLKDMHLRGAWLYDQIFASTATVQHLERHAAEFGLFRRPASRALGIVEIDAVADTTYPAGLRFTANGGLYRSTAAATAAANGDLRVTVISEDFGVVANVAAGAAITRADPGLYPGLADTGIVDEAGIGGGADTETDASLRERVLDRKRRPPQGASEADYEQWARAVPGVVKAWSHRFSHGPGTVGMWILFEGRTNLIPTAADVRVVQAEIDARRIIRSEHFVVSPRPRPLDVRITGLSIDTVAVRAAIEASIRAMLFERAEPGIADKPFVLSRSWIAEAISAAIGEDRHVLAAPSADIVHVNGYYPYLRNVTYG